MTVHDLRRGSPLSRVIVDIVTGGVAPRMADLVCCEQRWRRCRDGVVVVVRNVHRAERMLEVSYEPAVEQFDHLATLWPLPFSVLQADYELLVSAAGAR